MFTINFRWAHNYMHCGWE